MAADASPAKWAGGRKRLDLCVEYQGERYPIELKIRYDTQTETEGKTQIADYMDTLGCIEGWAAALRPTIYRFLGRKNFLAHGKCQREDHSYCRVLILHQNPGFSEKPGFFSVS